MKLYKIKQLHGAPKSNVTLIDRYILKENDEEVFNYIRDEMNWYCWSEDDFEEGYFETFDELKKSVMEEKGDLDSEDGWEDAHYGVTKYGWECLGEISYAQTKVLEKLKILEK